MAQDNTVVDSILDLIGQTALVRLNRLAPSDVAEVVVKMESLNPARSVKDRIGYSMIDAAEQSGALKPGMTIVEATSGNTGIGLALVAAAKGYRLVLTLPDSMSRERRDLLESYGAEVVLTSGADQMNGAVEEAVRIVDSEPARHFMPRQFDNPANPEIHRKTTAEEILNATDGKVDAFVSGVGTGGTVTGVGEVLKTLNSEVLIVAVEPEKSNVLAGGAAGRHEIQGIGAGFIPSVLNMEVLDRIVAVSEEDAFEMARRLAREEGMLVGVSAGANVWASLQVAKELGPGERVVTVICDSAERYYSVPGFLLQEGQ
ncbi:MAG TPA: cysteine synthase A [Candidatus Latescibacteria bacterium]|nr:cysteine synthase A [Candidatus Latescibacterota bacterium]